MYLWRHCNGGQKEGKKEKEKLIFFIFYFWVLKNFMCNQSGKEN